MRARVLGTLLMLSACGGSAPTDVPGARLEIAVGALSLADVTDVVYTLTVKTTATTPEVVWTKTIRASTHGNGAGGDAAYVGPCDASTATNTVHLTIDQILGPGAAPLTDFINPGELVQTATCSPDGDTPVRFDVTVARRASQGFFDVAVSFEDIFCSAKLDCLPELLHNGAERDTTIVVAFACTTGDGAPTVLHLDALALTCTDGTTYIDPVLGPGNTDQTSAHVFQVATYRDNESLPPYQKGFWNTAIGLDLASFSTQTPVDCTLTTRATASPSDWADGQTPLNQVWPYITWDVQVVDDSLLSCSAHALDVPGSGVTTTYATPPTRQRFGASMLTASCDDGTCDVVRKGSVCSGAVAGVDGPVIFAGTPGGVIVTVEGQSSAPLPLPPGYSLTGCCADPCCDL